MKISMKGRYAVRLMLDMALHNCGENVSLKDVAHRQDIPIKTLEQTANTLCKAGLLKSSRGKTGGYTLTQAPKDTTVFDILKVTDNLTPTGEGCDTCIKRDICCISDMWSGFSDITKDFFSKKTLEDLVMDQIRKQR